MSKLTNTIIKGIIVGALVALAFAFGFLTVRTAHGARPNTTPPDPNAITFTYDPNQAPNIVGWQTVWPAIPWQRDFSLWCNQDLPLSFTTSHGTAQRLTATVDPNTAPPDKTETHQINYTAPAVQGVVYIQIQTEVVGDPNTIRTGTFLLNVQNPPIETWLWTMRTIWPTGWLTKEINKRNQGPTANMPQNQRDWHKLQKVLALNAPKWKPPHFTTGILTEQQAELTLVKAWKAGKVDKP
jgi:hypothetical protein